MASTEIDLTYVADTLRRRRRVLQPEDVGMPRGRRRRTPGLRREEVAALCSMSTTYYSRLERRCGPRPSPAMLAGIARGLRFSGADRDRLFSAAGYGAGFVGADRLDVVAHVEPGLMHVLDRLADTPALVIDPLGRVLRQTPPATVLFGQLTFHTGWERSSYYRWFTGGGDRRSFTAGEQASIGTEIAAELRRGIDVHGCDQAAQLVTMLRRRSPELTALWQRSPGTVRPARPTHLIHPELGGVCLQREVLSDTEAGQRLVVYAAEPGSESQDTLRLVSVLGHHRFHM